jgi:hypothetical protein
MRTFPARRENPPQKIMGTRGFAGGLQQLSHPSAIKENELAEALNVRYFANGMLKKRTGCTVLGSASGTRIISLKGVYNINGNDYFLRISDTGVLQYYNFTNSVWTTISGSPTFSDTYTNILQSHGDVYFLNPLDPMTKWDGTTWSTWSAVADPTVVPVLAKSGTADDNIRQYYRYVWYNSTGYTFASGAAYIDDLPNTLDSTTYVSITVPTPPAGVLYTGIFKGPIAGGETYLDKIPANQTVYLDKGYLESDDTMSVPRSNTTAGYHFKYADIYHDTLIGTTIELGDETLVGSGGGDKFDSFGTSDGGFYYDWDRDSGDSINSVKTFTLSNEDGFYAFKRKKIGIFRFDSAGGSVRDINIGVGSVSHNSTHAAGNDLRTWGDDGAISVQNQANYANIIRTKILSIKADVTVQSVTQSDIGNVAGYYFDSLSLFGLPTGAIGAGNTTALVYDDQYTAWSEWRGLKPQIFAEFIGSDNKPTLYFGDSASGNVYEMFKGKTDGTTPITFRLTTKQFDNNKPFSYKKYKKLIIILGNVTGYDTVLQILEDGVRSQLPAPITQNTGKTGFGQDQWGEQLWGESSGTYEADTSGLLIRYADLYNKDLFSVQATVENDGINDELSIVGIYFVYADSSRPLPSSAKLGRSSTF